ncbi:MAG: prepilin-type N-terminal cleavage/methylation domain-containing protein [Myxococcales bacterium]|nr:prepilin-type N-terminal cleavage/methylation domain-containing protein [Myxococcales bacterium]
MFKNLRENKGFTLIELMIVVAIIAILAVVAVPQFTKYMRAAKTAEANEMLDLLKKGSASYYTAPRTKAGTQTRLPCQYPKTVSYAPTGSGCCRSADTDKDDRCDSSPASWNNSSWSALKFSITDQHYFQYKYESTGTLSTAKYTATANADLDCDSTYSTFQIVGAGDPKARFGECDSVNASAIFRNLETE